MMLGPVAARSQLVPCHRAADAPRIAGALSRIQHSVDPCGESAEMLGVLDRLERCARASYEICTSAETGRNLFEHPHGRDQPRTITWNPELRSELERGCDGDPARPVMRDPTASLLHEIVHAVHDCEGLNPGEYELEAVRIENIYRRAAGLCQRTRYGDDRLPLEMVRGCGLGQCDCSVPAAAGAHPVVHPRGPLRAPHAAATDGEVADSARPDDIDLDPVR
jgi:hypothetical protein